ncbi:hypothetical protein SESBI_36195 [Sesbania bispinosa]|nr:hypothetical protein SESBI_36195 [Sesbania bispinosa]
MGGNHHPATPSHLAADGSGLRHEEDAMPLCTAPMQWRKKVTSRVQERGHVLEVNQDVSGSLRLEK